MGVEEHNLKEEIKEIVNKAVKVGVLNDNCGVFRVMRDEQYSPKGKAIMLDEGFYEKILYECNLCKACEKPFFNSNLCDAFRKARQILVMQKKEIPAVREVIKNLRKTGNIYGVE